MFVNDVVWIVFWLLFFNKFNNIAGWTFNDMIMLYAIITIAWGIPGVFFGHRNKITKLIVEGKLDFYLTLPKNILYHVLISKSGWYSLGDILFGIVLAIVFIPLASIPLMILLIMMSSVIIIAFGVIIGSLAFYMSNSEQLSTTLIDGNLVLASYPLSIYEGFTKILLLTIIPAGFITGIPVQLLKQFDWTWFLLMIGFMILISIIAVITFYKGLKRYESGNMLYVRM
jgi:ABC-2 type transport system permease protein